jgi:4'-phosphopantetheinyl transferase
MPRERGQPADNGIEVDVVRAHVDDFPDLTPFRLVLSGEERHRADAYKVQESRDVFTLARGLLRVELSKRLGVEAGDVQFDVRASGKPDVRPGRGGRPDWRFSVSHTGPHAAVAFAPCVDVGIDIEQLDRKVNPLEIAKRYFTPREREALEGFAAEARTRAFFAGWTRKEAIVKARGHTMAESLVTLSVDVDPLATHPRYEDSSAVSPRPTCRLTAFEIEEHGLVGAVALQSDRAPRLRFEVQSAAKLRSRYPTERE